MNTTKAARMGSIIPFPDYERVYNVIYSVLEGRRVVAHACLLWVQAGAMILREVYKLDATPVAGAAAFLVKESCVPKHVTVFGRVEGGLLVSSRNAFHCWIESRGMIIDFMAPLFGDAIGTAARTHPVPRRMFQKPISAGASSLQDLQSEGDRNLSKMVLPPPRAPAITSDPE